MLGAVARRPKRPARSTIGGLDIERVRVGEPGEDVEEDGEGRSAVDLRERTGDDAQSRDGREDTLLMPALVQGSTCGVDRKGVRVKSDVCPTGCDRGRARFERLCKGCRTTSVDYEYRGRPEWLVTAICI